MKKILLLYTSAVGYGHKRSAEAVQKALNKKFPKNKTFLINAFASTNPRLEKFISFIRLNTLRFIPKTWKFIYRNEEKLLKSFSLIEKLVYFLFKPKFEKNHK